MNANITTKQGSRINENQIRDKWVPIIEGSMGVAANNPIMEWLPTYCHYHQISENSYATPGNTPGMGNVSLPGNPLGQYDFYNQTPGSGDKPVSYLAMSMQIAQDTIGFQCLPVVPADSSLTILTYVDFIYAGGFTDSTTDRPDIFKADVDFNTAIVPGAILTLNDTALVVANTLVAVFLGYSRIDAFPIFMVKTITTGYSINSALAAATAAGDRQITDGTTTGAATINSATSSYVRVLEDHIAGFSGVLFSKLKAAVTALASVDAMKYATMPYERGGGETTNTRSLGLKFYNKSVQAETWQVDLAVTREQVDDARQFGFDVLAKAQKVLVNEATQSINKNIVDRIFALGARNHKRIFDATGQHFNVNFDYTAGIGTTNFVLGWDAAGVLTTIITAAAVPAAKATTGGETLMTAQIRIIQQLLAAANEIERRGRREPADTIICNQQVATVLMSSRAFSAAAVQNTIRGNVGLRMMGTVAGMNVFVDPNMDYNDTRVAVFRKGDGETPGLIYMPYRIADIVDTIAESTMAPKMQLKSRGTIVEAGHNPELYYITLRINTQYGLLR